MTLNELTYLILGLNQLVDHGFEATIIEVEDHIDGGNLFAWLRRKFAGHIDLTIYDLTSEQSIVLGLQDILGGYRGQERRKWGVERNGICLLIAWVAELVQRRVW
jgi:hypothetical protein